MYKIDFFTRKKMKKISFIPNSQIIFDVVEPPIPSKKIIPEWYKKSTRFFDGNEYTMKNENIADIKSCIPFFDSISSGYIQNTWFDIQVESFGEEVSLRWRAEEFDDTFSTRPVETAKHFPKPEGVFNSHFVFRYPYSIKTPPGYSTLFTQPFNRFDTPFIALTGIVDTDTLITNGNYPIFIKKGFSGVINSGTPILQMIPFKRDDWFSEKENFNENENALSIIYHKIKNSYGFYKKNIWIKKEYR